MPPAPAASKDRPGGPDRRAAEDGGGSHPGRPAARPGRGEPAGAEEEARFPALDGLRGFAALAVIACHYQPHPAEPAGAAQKLWAAVVDSGWCGVDLFFVLSGFLITGVLLKARGSDRYFSSFYARRALRIFPLYYGLCLVSLVIVPAVAGPAEPRPGPDGGGRTIWYWVFLQNFVGILDVAHNRTLSVTWSLAVEEHFYLVWPLLVWALGAAASLRAILVVFVGQFAARNALYALGTPAEALHAWSFTHLDGIALGSALAIAWSDRSRYAGLLRAIRVQTWVSAPAWAALVAVASLDPVVWDTAYHPAMVTVGYTVCSLAFAGLLLNCLERDGPAARLFASKALRSCGRYSYAMYLLHFPVLSLATAAAGRFVPGEAAGGEALRLAVAAVSLAATYGLSALSWHVLEKRVLALKRFFPYAREPSSKAPPAGPPRRPKPAT